MEFRLLFFSVNCKENIPGTARPVFQDKKRSVCSLGGAAGQEPCATGRRPKAGAAAAQAICTVEPYGKGPCTVFHRLRRLVRRGTGVPPWNIRPTDAVVGRVLSER